MAKIVALRTSHLLKDDPAVADEFGTHKRIASIVSEEILHSGEGRSIALIGEWGSGKSTIIELLRTELARANTTPTHVFIYDAWSHQGDSLRRAFLDDFICSLDWHLKASEIARSTDQVWNRTEKITTTREPLLRRHAKVLLLTLALIPLGMKLFDLPSKAKLVDGLLSARNIVAYLFLLAPVIGVIIFGIINWTEWKRLKQFLFGENYKEAHFSVLSFFVERIQGQVEQKHIATPVDSIRTFREVFSQLLDDVHSRDNELRVVIIVDNIDRIPPDQAREFWSTMQTFFGDSGGLRRQRIRKYWLVAPFSLEALSFVFNDGAFGATKTPDTQSAARTAAKGYIDRTFALAFYVPPLILANWRKYLLTKLREALPDHGESDLIAVRDAFDFARSDLNITPREMKLFVNNLVVLYRQRGDEIALVVMAIYILHRDKIVGTTIGEDLIPDRERRLFGEIDWHIPIAALHFGVSPNEATQLLLQELMLTALREGSVEKLRQLESQPGFFDVLRRVTVSERESPTAQTGGMLAQFAATVGGLEGAAKPDLNGVWTDIRDRLRRVVVWDGPQSFSAEGIGAALIHTPDGDRRNLCEIIATALSKTAFPEPEGDFQKENSGAKNLLRAAKTIVEFDGRSARLHHRTAQRAETQH